MRVELDMFIGHHISLLTRDSHRFCVVIRFIRFIAFLRY